MIIGLISDTHGLIRDQALKALQGSDVIFHAGDVGSPEIIKTLEEIAPVYAVRGNTDRGIWAQSLSMTQMVDMGRKTFYVIHDLETLGIDPASAGVDVVIYGHSHIPKAERHRGILYFNPGSAGPRRFRLPVCLGKIKIAEEQLNTEWIDLK